MTHPFLAAALGALVVLGVRAWMRGRWAAADVRMQACEAVVMLPGGSVDRALREAISNRLHDAPAHVVEAARKAAGAQYTVG